MQDLEQLGELIKQASEFTNKITSESSKVIVGQKQIVEKIIVGLLTGGHLLLEGVPGLAKTLMINTVANIVSATFKRIQFTPDLLPADLIGTMIYSQKTESFVVKRGPIFANFILADEINRAPAKVQSALLEAMQEKQVTIGETTYKLEEPFLVLATQNPIEQEGTYPLPEAQMDRFMLKLQVDYPTIEEEREVLRRNIGKANIEVEKLLTPADVLAARSLVKDIYLDEKIETYILDIVFATREPAKYQLPGLTNLIACGASPRASINLAKAAKAMAFLRGRAYVIPEDVRGIVYDVMRHRIGITYEAEAESIKTEDIIREIINKIEVP